MITRHRLALQFSPSLGPLPVGSPRIGPSSQLQRDLTSDPLALQLHTPKSTPQLGPGNSGGHALPHLSLFDPGTPKRRKRGAKDSNGGSSTNGDGARQHAHASGEEESDEESTER